MSQSALSTPKALIADALKAEQDIANASTQSKALEAAIDAAEKYMQALRLTHSSDEKKKLDEKCKQLLTTAERIKESKTWRPAHRIVKLKEPQSTRKLSKREEIILLESAKLNGFIFPPWTSPPDTSDFELREGKRKFIDQPELTLAISQLKVFAGWIRPSEVEETKQVVDDSSSLELKAVDLVQDVTTDCSVVASLCAAFARAERGHHKIFEGRAYPYGEESSTFRGGLSPNGKYIFRFDFNGCSRKVVIDDRLPSSKTSRSLHVIDRNNTTLIWPALVEKAYLKVRGGYDFPGSNSGTDLWVLSGWIPEQIFLHREDVNSEQLWNRIFKAFQYGDVILTIGTGKLTEREEQSLGLVGRHDYAILDMSESHGRRRLLIKNPWSSMENATYQEQGVLRSPQYSQEASTPRDPYIAGSFWMDCEEVFQHFENLYLNWNPGLFGFREDIHFSWDLVKPRGSIGCFANNPQFTIRCEKGGPVWVLLSKHFRTDTRNQSESSHLVAFENVVHGEYISIYVYKGGGRHIILSDGAFHRTPYIDSPNTLARLDMPPNSTFTVVAAEQSLPDAKHNFTLSTYSTSPVILSGAEDKYSHSITMHAAWTSSTAGGNAESARYPANPQFSLQISDEADIAILLEILDPDIAAHVKIFWSNGCRVSSARTRDIVADSGEYRRGCAVIESENLAKGSYTIVCSTFAPDQLAKFSLSIWSTRSYTVKSLPPETAGKRVVTSAIGTLSPGIDRIIAPIEVPRLTRARLILRSKTSFIDNRSVAPSPMLMTVELGQGPYKEVLATSEDGEYSDSTTGIRIGQIDLHPDQEQEGGLWIAIERIGGPGGQIEDQIEVEALAEELVKFGRWGL